MGGYGSGKRWGAKNTTGDYLSLDVRRLQRDGLLERRYSFNWRWSRNGESAGNIDIRPDTDRVTLSYRHRSRGEDECHRSQFGETHKAITAVLSACTDVRLHLHAHLRGKATGERYEGEQGVRANYQAPVPAASVGIRTLYAKRRRQICGGETGIRTLDTLRYTRFPSVRLQPLGHLSTQCCSPAIGASTCGCYGRLSTAICAGWRQRRKMRWWTR